MCGILILENEVNMKKFYVVTRDYATSPSKFEFGVTTGKDQSSAYEKVDNELINSSTQAWVMSEKEFEALKEIIC